MIYKCLFFQVIRFRFMFKTSASSKNVFCKVPKTCQDNPKNSQDWTAKHKI